LDAAGQQRPWRELRCELSRVSQRFEHTRQIQLYLPHPGFPVDVRHNSKIFREKLAVWAAKKTRWIVAASTESAR
jgi:hypothetical protein